MLRLSLITTTILVLAACSISTEFAVVNTLDESLDVEIRLFAWNPCPVGADTNLAASPAADFEERLFRPVTPGWSASPVQPESLTDGCSFRIRIPPRTGVRIARIYNHPLPEDSDRESLAVQEVKFLRDDREVVLSSQDLIEKLEPLSGRLYALFPAHAV